MSDQMGAMFRLEMLHTKLSLEAEERERQAHSLHRIVGAIVDEVLARMEKEQPKSWGEWDSWGGRSVTKTETRESWKRRLISEVVRAHCPNADYAAGRNIG